MPDPRSVQFVVGKGGVGKSTITAALALAYSRAGRRVLAVELGRPEGLSRLLVPGRETGPEPIRLRERLWISRVQGDDALAEYLRLVLPGKSMLGLVFGSRLYRYFVAAAPGLKELMAIGKIWYERQKQDDVGQPFWDVIVVDAGASGHSLQCLQMPATAARTFRSGLVHRESAKIANMLADADATVVHVVTTAEEMPLAEARSIIEKLRGELGLAVGKLFVNRLRKAAPPGIDRMVAHLAGSSSVGTESETAHAVAETAHQTLSWIALQERNLAQFKRDIAIDSVRLPLLAATTFDLGSVEEISDVIAAALTADIE
jgi:anion-transporting  ArsA/GET3 family ATPase